MLTDVLIDRHPHPASPDAVRRDIEVVVAVLLGLLNALGLLALLSVDVDLSSTLVSSAVIIVANASLVPMLWWARRSLAAAWTGGSPQGGAR